MFRKFREINRIHFNEFKDEKFIDENPNALLQINKMSCRIRRITPAHLRLVIGCVVPYYRVKAQRGNKLRIYTVYRSLL